jgi:sarcosine oxidase, subunit alpha
MCNENGFLIDDGVVARLDEDTFLCHTTTGGADRIHAWMEDWLQTEWWDWKVYVANLTEQLRADRRRRPERAQGAGEAGRTWTCRSEALPFMDWPRAAGGHPGAGLPHLLLGRAVYEIAVPAGQGRALLGQR